MPVPERIVLLSNVRASARNVAALLPDAGLSPCGAVFHLYPHPRLVSMTNPARLAGYHALAPAVPTRLPGGGQPVRVPILPPATGSRRRGHDEPGALLHLR